MPQLFRPGANTLLRIGLAALLLVPAAAIGTAMVLVRSDYATGVGGSPVQPVPFSHAHHVGGLGIDCRYCHTGVETSAVAGVPPTETCMTCHSQLWTQAAMLAPVRESLAQGKPLRWARVHDLPGYVYFDHSVHIAKGVGCTTCHGPVDTMPLIRKAASLTMRWCLDCHRDPVPYLRPRDKVFATDWTPPPDQRARGAKLAAHAHIDTRHLTDCTVCHR